MKRIFSMDNGRATMAAHYGDIDVQTPEPKPLIEESGEPSGLARQKDGRILIGSQLLTMNSSGFAQVESFQIDFKEIPNEQNHDLLVEYAAAWRQHFLEKNPALFQDCEEYWIIGAPTGWRKKKIIEDYRQIFLEAGYPNPIIVLESNAAMCHAQHTYLAIDRLDPQMGALCIDLGAYSNDATYILPGEVHSTGGYTGASLIERMMLTLNLQVQYQHSKRSLNDPELVEAVLQKYRTDRNFRTYLLLHMRALKERYFKAVANGTVYTKDLVEYLELDGNDPVFASLDAESFILYTNDEMMKAAIWDLSIQQILGEEFHDLPKETQEEAGDLSWAGCLQAFIQRTMELCPKFAAAAQQIQEKPPAIILTGGAALMPFVEEIICEYLPHINLYKDASPSSTISKGLWFFGPKKLQAMEFDSAFEAILQEKNEEGVRVINIILSQAHDILGAQMNQDIATQEINCMVDAVEKWRKHLYDSSRIAKEAQDAFTKWFRTAQKEQAPKQAQACKKFITDQINHKFEQVLKDSGIENTQLLQENDLDLTYIDRFFTGFLDKVYEILNQEIGEEDGLYSQLQNPGRLQGMFLTSRSEMLGKIGKQLDERNEMWFKDTYGWLKKMYDSDEVYHPFVAECLYEICIALDRKKKELMGALIVEEEFDEA